MERRAGEKLLHTEEEVGFEIQRRWKIFENCFKFSDAVSHFAKEEDDGNVFGRRYYRWDVN